jgi:hypothetical protein
VSAVAAVMSDWFLALWSNNAAAQTDAVNMGIYGGLVALVFFTAILRGLAFYRVCSL